MLATLDDPTGGADPATVEAILTRGRGQIPRAFMDRFPHLRAVARCGVGLDNIDTDAAAERGIPVIYAPDSTTVAVAEHTILLMLALGRRLTTLAAAVAAGDWAIRNGYSGTELAGKTLGIVGMGSIGRRVATLATALGLKVVYWSQTSRDERFPLLPLSDLLAVADVVSLHLALTPATRHLIDAAALARMKPGALLINTARRTDHRPSRAVLRP